MSRSGLIALATAALTAPPGAQQPAPDLIIHNARIYTAVDARPQVSAVAIRGSRLVAVGQDADVLTLRGAATQIVNLEGKTVVSFCTGGIRCEKAGIYLQEQGLEHVYQLEGGILKYFELTDGAPGWTGSCFVFDEREVLGAQLVPTRT